MIEEAVRHPRFVVVAKWEDEHGYSRGPYRIRDTVTGEWRGIHYRFGDAAEHAYELEKQSEV